MLSCFKIVGTVTGYSQNGIVFFLGTYGKGLVSNKELRQYKVEKTALNIGDTGTVIYTSKKCQKDCFELLLFHKSGLVSSFLEKSHYYEHFTFPEIINIHYDEDYIRKYTPSKLDTEIFRVYIESIEKNNEKLFVRFSRKKCMYDHVESERNLYLQRDYEYKYNGKPINYDEYFLITVEGIMRDNSGKNSIVVAGNGTLFDRDRVLFGYIDAKEFSEEEIYKLDYVSINSGIVVRSLNTLHKYKSCAFQCDDGVVLESTDETKVLSKDTILYKVKLGNTILPDAETLAARWWLCQYPEGKWEEAYEYIKADNRVSKNVEWEEIEIVKQFDQKYIDIRSFEFRFAEAPFDISSITREEEI